MQQLPLFHKDFQTSFETKIFGKRDPHATYVRHVQIYLTKVQQLFLTENNKFFILS